MIKISIIIIFVFINSLLFAGEDELSTAIKLLKIGNEESIEKTKAILLEMNPDNNSDSFKKHYLLSFCYYSGAEPDSMKKTIINLGISVYDLKNIVHDEYNRIIKFIESMDSIYDDIIDFKEYTYEDLEEIIEYIFSDFDLKIQLLEILHDYDLTRLMKRNLNSFKNNVLKNRDKEKITILYERLDNVLNSKETIEILIKDGRK